jgi:hypothetical protein
MKRAHLILWLLIAALASWSGSARADRQPSEEAAPTEPVDQPVDPRAAELKRQGDALMFDLRYEEALALYQQSYAIDPNPALLYNQGRAHQARGSFPEALQMLERFDAEAPDNLKERVPNLAELIGQLRNNVTELTIRCNVNGAKVLLHNREIGATPLKRLVVNAGNAEVQVSAAGHLTVTKKIVLPGGGKLELPIELKTIAGATVLAVRSPVAGAIVFVDGARIGVTPAEANVKPGKRLVVLRHDDYEEATTTAIVEAGVRKQIDVPLVELPAIYEAWWFWTGIGAVAAGVTVGVILGVTEGPVVEGDIPPGVVQAPLISF